MKDVDDWYKGPTSRVRVATLRKKLAIARGMLEEIAQARSDRGVRVVVSDPDAPIIPTASAIRRVLKQTKD